MARRFVECGRHSWFPGYQFRSFLFLYNLLSRSGEGKRIIFFGCFSQSACLCSRILCQLTTSLSHCYRTNQIASLSCESQISIQGWIRLCDCHWSMSLPRVISFCLQCLFLLVFQILQHSFLLNRLCATNWFIFVIFINDFSLQSHISIHSCSQNLNLIQHFFILLLQT